MLRKKFYERRDFFYERRKIFYVASPLTRHPPRAEIEAVDESFHGRGTFFHGWVTFSHGFLLSLGVIPFQLGGIGCGLRGMVWGFLPVVCVTLRGGHSSVAVVGAEHGQIEGRCLVQFGECDVLVGRVRACGVARPHLERRPGHERLVAQGGRPIGHAP